MDDSINNQDKMLVETKSSRAILDRMTTFDRTTWLISSEQCDLSNHLGGNTELIFAFEVFDLTTLALGAFF
jgi:hypothetical protein